MMALGVEAVREMEEMIGVEQNYQTHMVPSIMEVVNMEPSAFVSSLCLCLLAVSVTLSLSLSLSRRLSFLSCFVQPTTDTWLSTEIQTTNQALAYIGAKIRSRYPRRKPNAIDDARDAFHQVVLRCGGNSHSYTRLSSANANVRTKMQSYSDQIRRLSTQVAFRLVISRF